ncbi:uncharacterized protein ACIBXB_003239 [Morphnus guianensis]
MQTGILVIVTLLVWHPSGCSLCPCAGPGCCLGARSMCCRVRGLLGPQTLLLQPLARDQGSSPCAWVRPRERFTWEGPGRAPRPYPLPGVMGCSHCWSHPSWSRKTKRSVPAQLCQLSGQAGAWRGTPATPRLAGSLPAACTPVTHRSSTELPCAPSDALQRPDSRLSRSLNGTHSALSTPGPRQGESGRLLRARGRLRHAGAPRGFSSFPSCARWR